MMKKLLCSFISVMMLGSVLVGCGGKKDAAPATSTTKPAATQEVKGKSEGTSVEVKAYTALNEVFKKNGDNANSTSTGKVAATSYGHSDKGFIAFIKGGIYVVNLQNNTYGYIEYTDYLEKTLPEHVTVVKSLEEVDPKKFKLVILVTPYNLCVPYGVLELHFVPMIASLGFGLASHPNDYEDIYDEIDEAMSQIGVLPCYKRYCTIDVKQDEEFCAMLVDDLGEELVFYTAEELAKVEVPNPSKTVEKHVGTPSVCEAAAILGANNGKLIVPKVKGRNWTAALAIDYKYLREQKGHIEIVGAGPGDPDLVSVRGRKMLERADLILYAGSLVPKALTECHKPGAVVRSSADMALEEQCELMKKFYDEGKYIVRLHTGDPCIFGAIQEQMAFFDANHMEYHITPGISSFLAAAAELQSQFTIPERCQTIILTRGEGRTPMPEKEQLHLLAKSQSTMCIFLSAAIVDDVQRELLQEYPEDTPVAACYHLTWPDQKIYRGKLKDLAKIVHDNKLTLTTMLVVGEAIDNRQGLSELYSKHFTHLFRQGDDGKGS